jgi:VanZ family protein
VEETLQTPSYRPLRKGLALAWTALILALCLTPSTWLPRSESHGPPLFNIPHFDKIVHVALFAGFGLLWCGALRSPGRLTRVLIAGLIFAVATEVLQGLPFVDRDPDLVDGLADAFGVVLGVGTAWLGSFLFRPDDQR